MLGRSVRTSQPQGPSLAGANLSSGLLVANTPTLGRINAVNGSPSIVESGVVGTRARPKGVQFNAATASRGWGVSGLSALTLHTLYDASSGFQRSFNAASSSINQTLFWDFSYPTLYLVLFNGSYPALVNTGITRPTSGVVALTAVATSGGYRAYVNGIFAGQTTSLPLNFSVIDQVGFMYRQSGSLFNDVLTGGLFGAAWNRALSDAEIKSLSDNPWQIFAPDTKSLWVPSIVATGGAATVIPISVQATGSVGTPSATGAAAVTPAGVSTSSAVGTPVAVGGASIPATVLPAGVQATAAIGTVSARGAAVAQPAGVTASGAVGAPVAIGEATGVTVVYPAGVQASSAVGTPTVTAAANAQPLGVAAIAYVGTPTIATGVSGVAVAYPSGVQAIGQVGTLIATGAAWTAAVGVQAVASVGTPFAYEGELVSTTAGAQTRPSRLQSSGRASRIQTGSRASR